MENEEHYYPHTEPPSARKPSGLGIASFIIGLISILGVVGAVLLLTASIPSILETGGAIPAVTPENAGEYMPLIISSLLLMLVLILGFIGLVLGIFGLIMKNRRKAFAIIGVVLNGLLLSGYALLITMSRFLTAA
ncbi:hypothetical protein ACFOQM_12835 [Paenibacillus sp. GCM10012307]|uniref:DUF4064 domain-containing protein n=1 Tax=Paenibacillus roseus TaxID=2798579 RepID=A0A934J5P1_9BACL|nr:hypothetical protein [Paenibacillus roseus]MBJ6362179.1 hypothetical protein [Paenibacillus roseus]